MSDPILTTELAILQHEYSSFKKSFLRRLYFLVWPRSAYRVTDQLDAIVDYQSLKGVIDIEVKQSPVKNVIVNRREN